MVKISEITVLRLEDRLIIIENGGRPEVHGLKKDKETCERLFSEGSYRLHVFEDVKKALGYQELIYKKKSKGYLGLEKYLTNNKLI